MLLIADTNILYAAVLKDSTSRKILLTAPIDFIVPEFVFQELNEHIDEICEKDGLSREANFEIIGILRDHVGVLNSNDIVEALNEAKEIMKDIDLDDTPILATALSVQNDGIWSEDPHLRKQSHIKIWRTRDLLHFLVI